MLIAVQIVFLDINADSEYTPLRFASPQEYSVSAPNHHPPLCRSAQLSMAESSSSWSYVENFLLNDDDKQSFPFAFKVDISSKLSQDIWNPEASSPILKLW